VGRVVDTETGLLYETNRYYDPSTGQFLTRDPLDALTGSAYGYVADNPLNGTDPWGLGPVPGAGCQPQSCPHGPAVNPLGNPDRLPGWYWDIYGAAGALGGAALAAAVAPEAAALFESIEGAGVANTASNIATVLADADVVYSCNHYGFGSRACQAGIFIAGVSTFVTVLPLFAAALPSVELTVIGKQLFALIGLTGSAITGWLEHEMACPGAPG